jgi:HAMP domain-containing protein
VLATAAVWGNDGPPRSRLSRGAAAGDARAARDAAADAFYRMDRLQRDIQVRVDAYTNLDAGNPTATRVREQFQELSGRADAGSRAYIEALDRHDVDEDLATREFVDAARDFAAVRQQLDALAAELEAFPGRFATQLAEVERALAAVPERAGAAMRELEAARRAVQACVDAAVAPGDAGETLQEAESAAATLSRGAAVLGVGAALRQADLVVTLARRASARAEDLRRQKEDVTRRLASLRTRAEALQHRATGVEPVMSELRRAFVLESWDDLADVSAVAAEQVTLGLSQLAEARRLAAAGDYAAAAPYVRSAAAALDRADERLRAVTTRREALREVKENPQDRVARVRFALRDAQRLVMTGRTAPEPRHAAVLDPLVGRLEAAQEALERTHPDYWGFIQELDAIAATIERLVQDYRAGR